MNTERLQIHLTGSRAAKILFSFFTLVSGMALVYAEPQPTKPLAFPATKIEAPQWKSHVRSIREQAVVVGTPRRDVEKMLGAPDKKIGPDVVFYDNCEPNERVADSCCILVVTFNKDAVADLTFVNDAAANVISNYKVSDARENMLLKTDLHWTSAQNRTPAPLEK